ncbi:TLR2 [Mytilus coruscus]|uniref:TLR2 n=1 Tax=Mytilus coruscus TaxID=42192 RepID=A0A6J8AJ36_MYTCO|nr:TLR2 [Mytilus coruscus]
MSEQETKMPHNTGSGIKITGLDLFKDKQLPLPCSLWESIHHQSEWYFERLSNVSILFKVNKISSYKCNFRNDHFHECATTLKLSLMEYTSIRCLRENGTSHADLGWVLKFYKQLQGLGHNMSFDEKDFLVGAFISENIYQGLGQSRKVIFIITKHFLQSTRGKFELEVARKLLKETSERQDCDLFNNQFELKKPEVNGSKNNSPFSNTSGKFIETKYLGHRISFDEKDFLVGAFISDNIYQAFRQSRKVTFIITVHFLHSTWGEFELEVARTYALENGRHNMIIVVLKDDVSFNRMPNALKDIWYKTTCVLNGEVLKNVSPDRLNCNMSNKQENLEKSEFLNKYKYDSFIANGSFIYKTKYWDNAMNNYPELNNKIIHASSRDHSVSRTIFHDFRFNKISSRNNTIYKNSWVPCYAINVEASKPLITPQTTLTVSYGFVKTCTINSSSCHRYKPINQEKTIIGNTISSIIKTESEDFKDTRQVTLPCSLLNNMSRNALCHADIDWVLKFYNKLHSLGHNISFDEKDFLVGAFISDNIYQTLGQSRKVIFIITEHFLESTWGEFELEVARTYALENGRHNMIIVVLKDEIDINRMPNVLKDVWYKITCIKWFKSEYNKDDDKNKHENKCIRKVHKAISGYD